MILLRGGCFPILASLVVTIFLNIASEQLGSALMPIISVYNEISRIALLIVVSYILYLILHAMRTTYVITSQRLLEVRGKSIKKEIIRENLRGLNPGNF